MGIHHAVGDAARVERESQTALVRLWLPRFPLFVNFSELESPVPHMPSLSNFGRFVAAANGCGRKVYAGRVHVRRPSKIIKIRGHIVERPRAYVAPRGTRAHLLAATSWPVLAR